ncbi:hypothetical protein K1719_009190 [Acacia pycnantha]|nr:hypothetical protein K1719_009190 [Acacia pycnantha]
MRLGAGTSLLTNFRRASVDSASLERVLIGIKMKKGLHPQMQWISYVTQSGRLMHVMMTKIHPVGKVYHFRAKRQMAESLGQIAKFRRRFEQQNEDSDPK